MTDTDGVPPGAGVDSIRPLSVRMYESARAQLEILAQLNGRSVTEEIRLALEAWVEQSKRGPEGQEVREDIEREAAMRRSAIESIFAGEPERGRGYAAAPKE